MVVFQICLWNFCCELCCGRWTSSE